MNGCKPITESVRPVRYQPATGYLLDLEIMPMSTLRARKGDDFLNTRERIEFHMIVFITENKCTHMVDLEQLECKPGSILVLHPGQIHSFDVSVKWQGWLILFRPEFLFPQGKESLLSKLNIVHQLEELPTQLQLENIQQNLLTDCITRMWHDTMLDANSSVLNTLLQNQLHALLNRLYLISSGCDRKPSIIPTNLHRYKRFRYAVEHNFHQWHKVSDYTNLLGYSEKSLSRLTNEVSGVSAKTFLSKRIALEAKRYLSNTELSVTNIADKLGFDEVTNFTKFFKREAGCSPRSFRRFYLCERNENLSGT